MVYIPLDCPHCNTQKVAFGGDHTMQCDNEGHEHILLLQCAACHNGVVAKFQGTGIMHWLQTRGQTQPPRLIKVWPEAKPPIAPRHLPDNIHSFYLQGIDSLRRRNYDASGTMFRKSLDVALKRIFPEGRGSLEKRINALPLDLGITAAMKEWAHEIRKLGNDAAHEDDPFDEEEVLVLQSFTEMFLTYAFTLPGMLRERREPASGDVPPHVEIGRSALPALSR